MSLTVNHRLRDIFSFISVGFPASQAVGDTTGDRSAYHRPRYERRVTGRLRAGKSASHAKIFPDRFSPRARLPLFITSRMRCLLKKFAAMNQAAASDHCYRRTYPARERNDAFSQSSCSSFRFSFYFRLFILVKDLENEVNKHNPDLISIIRKRYDRGAMLEIC